MKISLYKSYDLIVAVEAFTSIQTDYEKAFEDLYQYQSKANDWLIWLFILRFKKRCRTSKISKF